jgi:hypothetical protein
MFCCRLSCWILCLIFYVSLFVDFLYWLEKNENRGIKIERSLLEVWLKKKLLLIRWCFSVGVYLYIALVFWSAKYVKSRWKILFWAMGFQGRRWIGSSVDWGCPCSILVETKNSVVCSLNWGWNRDVQSNVRSKVGRSNLLNKRERMCKFT